MDLELNYIIVAQNLNVLKYILDCYLHQENE